MSEASVRRIDVADDDESFTPSPNPTIGSNPLDALRAVLTAAVERPDITLEVLSRPGLSIRFSTNVDLDTVQMWRKRSQDKAMPDNFNLLKFSQLCIANTASAFLLDGEEVPGANGPVSFRSPEVLEMTQTKRALDAVRALYGIDGHVIATAAEVLDAAGFGDEMEEVEEGPTRRS